MARHCIAGWLLAKQKQQSSAVSIAVFDGGCKKDVVPVAAVGLIMALASEGIEIGRTKHS